MSCSLVYDSVLGRVRIDAASVGATATHATVERSPDASTYTMVRGGDAVVVTGQGFPVPVDDYEFPLGTLVTYRVTAYNASNVQVSQTTCTITPTVDRVWFKSVERPFLNRQVDCVTSPAPFEREARVGLWEIIGRSFAVATTDVRAGYNFEVRVTTSTYAERVAFDYLLASGDLLYVQPPIDFPLESMFVEVGDVTETHPVRNRDCADWWQFELPLTQVQPPDDDVVGTTATWLTVVHTYATWSALMAAKSTWADVLDIVADPSEAIVP